MDNFFFKRNHFSMTRITLQCYCSFAREELGKVTSKNYILVTFTTFVWWNGLVRGWCELESQLAPSIQYMSEARDHNH